MRFTRLSGQNFRLFGAFELAPHPRLNLILGPNASGKTTLLEAIYALGRGRSFRGAPPDLAGRAGSQWVIQGTAAREGYPEVSLGLGWSAEGLRIRMDQADATLQALVQQVPVQVLEPDSHRLVEDGPVYRRQYLDWGVFHVEHQFFPAWRRYQRALRQRNQALRDGADRLAAESWNREIADSGEEVHRYRSEHAQALREALGTEIRPLLGDLEWSLELRSGWAAERSLADSLAAHYDNDARQGTTLSGPHRAELKLRLDHRSVKTQASRGQQKLLVAALLLAQAKLVRAATQRAPILLIDDFPAELGPGFQGALFAALERYAGQCFLSSIEPTAVLEKALKNTAEISVFHVEQGSIRAPSRV